MPPALPSASAALNALLGPSDGRGGWRCDATLLNAVEDEVYLQYAAFVAIHFPGRAGARATRDTNAVSDPDAVSASALFPPAPFPSLDRRVGLCRARRALATASSVLMFACMLCLASTLHRLRHPSPVALLCSAVHRSHVQSAIHVCRRRERWRRGAQSVALQGTCFRSIFFGARLGHAWLWAVPGIRQPLQQCTEERRGRGPRIVSSIQPGAYDQQRCTPEH